MKPNRTKAKIKAGGQAFGCFLRYPDAALVEFLCYQGWDFIVFDAEHGPIEPRDCENMVRACELHDVTPMVRVTTNCAPTILRYMDTGVQGAHVPWVNSAAEAELAIQAIKYEPRGLRGLGGVRAADYGQAGPFSEYVHRANAETLVVIHVETAQAIAELAKTTQLDGLDVLFIGATDLSQSFGVTGQSRHPLVLDAINRIVCAVSNSPVALGTIVPNVEEALKYKERGARYIAITFENVMGAAAKEYLRIARNGLSAASTGRHS